MIRFTTTLFLMFFISAANAGSFWHFSDKPVDSVIKIRAESVQGLVSGSGVIVGPGRIVTAYHVVNGAHEVEAEVNGEVLQGNVLLHDLQHDLALISVPTEGMPYVPLLPGDQHLAQQQLVSLVGFPFGDEQQAYDAMVSSWIDSRYDEIYVNAPILGGESGGGLFATVDGQVYLAGVITASTSTGVGEGISGGTAVPVAYLRRMLTAGRSVASR